MWMLKLINHISIEYHRYINHKSQLVKWKWCCPQLTLGHHRGSPRAGWLVITFKGTSNEDGKIGVPPWLGRPQVMSLTLGTRLFHLSLQFVGMLSLVWHDDNNRIWAYPRYGNCKQLHVDNINYIYIYTQKSMPQKRGTNDRLIIY